MICVSERELGQNSRWRQGCCRAGGSFIKHDRMPEQPWLTGRKECLNWMLSDLMLKLMGRYIRHNRTTENRRKVGTDFWRTCSPKIQKLQGTKKRNVIHSLASPHTTTAGLSCQTASLLFCVSEKHPVAETSTGWRDGTEGPEMIICCSLLPCYLWARTLTRLLRALVFRTANRFYPGVRDTGGSGSRRTPMLTDLYEPKRWAGWHCDLDVKLLEIPPQTSSLRELCNKETRDK